MLNQNGESTVRFLDDCKAFYRLVEQNYRIDGFFNSWQQHIELDLEYGHASNFASILSATEYVSRADLLRSLQNARFTFDFLIGALDEVLTEDIWGDKIFLRSSIRDSILDPRCSALLAPYADRTSLPKHLEARQATELYDELRNALAPFGTDATTRQSLAVDHEFILSDLTI